MNNTFVFQSIPERYDLRSNIEPGKRDTWYATRYRSEMRKGDLVFFWMAGDENFRGLYGWGEIVSEPYMKAEWQSHGVDVEYKHKFRKPILARSLKHDSALANMLIFRAPQATNFLLDSAQTKRLSAFIKEKGEKAPAQKGASE